MVATRQQVEALVTGEAKADKSIGVGLCWDNVHTALQIPAKFATAALGWEGAEFKHAWAGGDKDAPPLFAPVCWTGGHTIVAGKPAGHVAFYAGKILGIHHVWSPGAPGTLTQQSEWELVGVDSIVAGWPGHELVGWIEDVNSVRVPWLEPTAAAPKPTPVTRGSHVDTALASLARAAKNAKNGTARHQKITAAITELHKIATKPAK